MFDGVMCEEKAALVLRGRSARVEGLIFTNMRVADGNGAGIRIEQGDLAVSETMFVDGQCGILSANDPNSRITIDRSTFSGLGRHPDGNGAHALYIGDYGSLRVTNSRFERGTGGHYLKSRAARIEVLDFELRRQPGPRHQLHDRPVQRRDGPDRRQHLRPGHRQGELLHPDRRLAPRSRSIRSRTW